MSNTTKDYPGVVTLRLDDKILVVSSRKANAIETEARKKLREQNHHNRLLQDLYDKQGEKAEQLLTFTITACDTLDDANLLKATLVREYKAEGLTLLNLR
jgi:hypothetical protein